MSFNIASMLVLLRAKVSTYLISTALLFKGLDFSHQCDTLNIEGQWAILTVD
jgi:hypothetical protein